MNKIDEAILSGQYSSETCQNFISVISNVPGDSTCALLFFSTIQNVFIGLTNNQKLLKDLLPSLIRAILKMVIKAPILFEVCMEFICGKYF